MEIIYERTNWNQRLYHPWNGAGAFPYLSSELYSWSLQVPFHWHKEIEIIWVEQGQLELTLGTQHKVLKERDFVMINSYELHQLQSIGNTASISSRTGISSRHALFFLSRSESAVFSEAAAVSSTSASFLCIRKSSLRIIYSQNISGDSS